MWWWILGGVVTTIAVIAFWDEIADFFKKSLQRAKQAIDGIIQASKAYIKKCKSGSKVIIRHDFKKNRKKYVHEETRNISSADVPDEIKALEKYGKEVEITSKLELYL